MQELSLQSNPMAEVDRANWARNIQINLVGVQDLTNRLIPVMGGKQQSRVTTFLQVLL